MSGPAASPPIAPSQELLAWARLLELYGQALEDGRESYLSALLDRIESPLNLDLEWASRRLDDLGRLPLPKIWERLLAANGRETARRLLDRKAEDEESLEALLRTLSLPDRQ